MEITPTTPLAFQSTPSAWRETKSGTVKYRTYGISIHSLRMEGDSTCKQAAASCRAFQSTPSAWRETTAVDFQLPTNSYFNPLPPHGGRPGTEWCRQSIGCHFNPLPPHGGRRLYHGTCCSSLRHFNPLPPHGGRPGTARTHIAGACISIHSLRMEGDTSAAVSKTYAEDFNPLPPHGGRPCRPGRSPERAGISIHSLRMEGDAQSASMRSRTSPFQSTPSAWRETFGFSGSLMVTNHFNPLPPHGGRPLPVRSLLLTIPYFNPLPPHGGRRGGDKACLSA